MKYEASATVTFSAGHKLPMNEWCGDKFHGHSYTVTVTWDREGFASTDHELWAHNRGLVLSLAMELKDRTLNDMLGPQFPNVFGVATFFKERLAINIPVTRVEVREDSGPIAIIDTDR